MNYRILIVAPPFNKLPIDSYGGVEKVTIERGLKLKDLGNYVSYVVPKGSALTFSDKNFYVDRVPSIDFGQDLKGHKITLSFVIAMFKFYKEFSRLIVDDKFDLIINDVARNDPFNLINFNRIFGSKHRIDVLHGNTKIALRFRKPKIYPTPILGALSTRLATDIKKNGWRGWYFPNGIAIPNRGEIDTSPENYFIFIGRIMPNKGVKTAIKIARRLKKTLYLFGWIQDTEYYNSMIKPLLDSKNVVYMGNTSRKELIRYLRHAYALLFTSSYSDPQPSVLLEAISYGVPILALTPGYYSGFYDICKEENTVVSKTVDKLVESSQRLKDIDRETIYEDAKSNWSWTEVITSKYVPLIEELGNL